MSQDSSSQKAEMEDRNDDQVRCWARRTAVRMFPSYPPLRKPKCMIDKTEKAPADTTTPGLKAPTEEYSGAFIAPVHPRHSPNYRGPYAPPIPPAAHQQRALAPDGPCTSTVWTLGATLDDQNERVVYRYFRRT